jgi:hypothetical protein
LRHREFLVSLSVRVYNGPATPYLASLI